MVKMTYLHLLRPNKTHEEFQHKKVFGTPPKTPPPQKILYVWVFLLYFEGKGGPKQKELAVFQGFAIRNTCMSVHGFLFRAFIFFNLVTTT